MLRGVVIRTMDKADWTEEGKSVHYSPLVQALRY